MIVPNTKRTIVGIVALLSLLIVITFTIQQTNADSDEVFEVSTDWDTPHTKVSESENGARKPVISASQVSNRVLVVYDHWTGSEPLTDKDPYYSISTNGGTTWPTGQPIFTSPNGSNQTVGLLDYQDRAFAVWVEDSALASTLTYAHMPKDGAWSSATQITTVSNSEGKIFDPFVSVDANNTLHLVWSKLDIALSGQNIYYASRPQGDSWSKPVQINNTNPPSREPSIAVDSNNNLHIVWEETTNSLGAEIRYSSGTISSNNFVVGSANYVKLSPDEIDEAVLPIVNVSEGKMQVMYTNILSQAAQNVYFGSCSLPCSGFNSGVFKSVTSFVSVNGSNPFNLVADLDYSTEKNASFIYFHGAQDTNENESVMGRSSCSGWSDAAQDNVTDPSAYRAIEPSISIKGNTMHLAYDRIDSSGSGFDHQIYVTKSNVNNTICDVPTVRFQTPDYTVNEGDDSATIEVSLSPPQAVQVTVDFSTGDGTATSPEDYTVVTNQQIVFNPGDSIITQTVSVPIVDDNLNEFEETVNLSLSNAFPDDVLIDPNFASATLIIEDNDPEPDIMFSADAYTVNRGDGQITLDLKLSDISGREVTVNYATGGGTATPGADYEENSGTVTFAKGQLAQSIEIIILDDNDNLMDDEIFYVTLSEPNGAILSPPTEATVVIEDNAQPDVMFSSYAYTVNWGDDKTILDLKLSAISDQEVTVKYATGGGTAIPGIHYEEKVGTVTFPKGQMVQSIEIFILIDNDNLMDDETFYVTLSEPIGATLASPTEAKVTIKSQFFMYLPVIVDN